MTAPRPIEFWFDFVSGYSWLAAAQAAEFAEAHGVRWQMRPFVLGAVLQHISRRTVAQDSSSRGYAIFDVARNGARMGLTMNGPPQHPFVSLKALRAVVLQQDTEHALPLTRELFAAGWERNEDLTNTAVVLDCVARVGLQTGEIEAGLRDPATKARLHDNTDAAVAAGIFGAPFFFLDGEPFWGQDRLPLLAERLGGAPAATNLPSWLATP